MADKEELPEQEIPQNIKEALLRLNDLILTYDESLLECTNLLYEHILSLTECPSPPPEVTCERIPAKVDAVLREFVPRFSIDEEGIRYPRDVIRSHIVALTKEIDSSD